MLSDDVTPVICVLDSVRPVAVDSQPALRVAVLLVPAESAGQFLAARVVTERDFQDPWLFLMSLSSTRRLGAQFRAM